MTAGNHEGTVRGRTGTAELFDYLVVADEGRLNWRREVA